LAETAVAVIVPEADALVSRWRRVHTRDGAEGMPAHVTLLYPFVPTESLTPEHVATAANVLAEFPPFDLTLTRCRFFGPPEPTLWLEPTPAEPFLAMIGALARVFPDHPPYGGMYERIVPHLTIAHGESPLLESIASEVAASLPLRACVTEAALAEETVDGWRTRTRLPLGRDEGGTQP
jgi:2'-5' RNA ligase